MRKKYHNVVRALVVLTMVVALLGAIVAPAAAQDCGDINISAASGTVGAPITVSVNAAPGEWQGLPVTVQFDGAAIATSPAAVAVDPLTGDATLQIQVPATIAGPQHVITVKVGFTSCIFSFEVLPAMTISPKIGPAGTAVTVTGSGFGAPVPVTVQVQVGGATIATGVAVNADGSFTATGTIPPGLPAGGADVYAVDGAANDATLVDGFTVSPSLFISPTTGLAGSQATVTGSGWDPLGGTVNLTFAGQAWISGIAVSSTGSFSSTAATLTTTPSGGMAIAGVQGTNAAATTFTVQSRPLTLTPNTGPKGTKVTITAANLTLDGTVAVGGLTIGGAGWNPAVIQITTGGALTPTTLVTPSTLTTGDNTALLTDSGGLSAAGIYTVTQPTVGINPTTGPVGSAVTIQGAGWVPNSQVSLDFAGAGMTVFADANGNIAAAMSVPATAVPGPNNLLTANDGGAGNAAVPAAFTVPGAYITIDPGEGSAGDAVTVSGSGFPGYVGVQVMFGSYTIPTTVLTSALGDFSLATTVPGVAPGATVVTATAAGSVTATTFFVVLSAPVTIKNQLAGIMDELVIVWDYNGGDWRFYDPADEAGSTLETLVAGSGYWMKVTEDVELIFGGTSYQLTEGWNNIGWRGY